MNERETAVRIMAAGLAHKQWERLCVDIPNLTPWGELDIKVMDERIEYQIPFAEELLSVTVPWIFRGLAYQKQWEGARESLLELAYFYETGKEWDDE